VVFVMLRLQQWDLAHSFAQAGRYTFYTRVAMS